MSWVLNWSSWFSRNHFLRSMFVINRIIYHRPLSSFRGHSLESAKRLPGWHSTQGSYILLLSFTISILLYIWLWTYAFSFNFHLQNLYQSAAVLVSTLSCQCSLWWLLCSILQRYQILSKTAWLVRIFWAFPPFFSRTRAFQAFFFSVLFPCPLPFLSCSCSFSFLVPFFFSFYLYFSFPHLGIWTLQTRP